MDLIRVHKVHGVIDRIKRDKSQLMSVIVRYRFRDSRSRERYRSKRSRSRSRGRQSPRSKKKKLLQELYSNEFTHPRPVGIIAQEMPLRLQRGKIKFSIFNHRRLKKKNQRLKIATCFCFLHTSKTVGFFCRGIVSKKVFHISFGIFFFLRKKVSK